MFGSIKHETRVIRKRTRSYYVLKGPLEPELVIGRHHMPSQMLYFQANDVHPRSPTANISREFDRNWSTWEEGVWSNEPDPIRNIF